MNRCFIKQGEWKGENPSGRSFNHRSNGMQKLPVSMPICALENERLLSDEDFARLFIGIKRSIKKPNFALSSTTGPRVKE